MTERVFHRPWFRQSLVVLAILVLLSPVFAWAAEAVNYAEPLEHAAAVTGAASAASTILPGLFPDYSIPGLGPWVGTLVAGLVGTAVTLALGVAIGRFLTQ